MAKGTRSTTVTATITPDERDLIAAAAERELLTISTFARRVLVAAATESATTHQE